MNHDETPTQTLERLSAELPHPVEQFRESAYTRELLGPNDGYEAENPKRDFRILEELAVLYQNGDDSIRVAVGQRVAAFVNAWEESYHPAEVTDKVILPIDQRFLPKLFVTAAMAWDQLPQEGRENVLALAERAVDLEDTWWSQQKPNSARAESNIMAHSFNLRLAYAALEIKDDPKKAQSLLETYMGEYETFLKNFIDAQGATYDYKVRDSLHYQVFGLQPIFEAAVLIGGMDQELSDQSRGLLRNAVVFLRPFILGDETHLEYLNSQNLRDRERHQEEFGRVYSVRSQSNHELLDLLASAQKLFPEESWIDEAIQKIR